MEAVSAHALGIEVLRNGIVVGSRAVTAVEGRIEAGNLRQLRQTARIERIGSQIVRLMQRRERDIALQRASTSAVIQNRAVVIGAAVHHAVADGASGVRCSFAQPAAARVRAPSERPIAVAASIFAFDET